MSGPGAREITGGVWSIELPLPFELEAINVYLVRLQTGFLLVDCGLDTDESLQTLEAALVSIGVGWADIRTVVLTHMHPDHVGLCGRIAGRSGATIMMQEIEASHLNEVVAAASRLPWLHEAYTQAGVPEELQVRMDEAFGVIRQSLHRVTPDRLLADQDRIDSAIGPLIVHWTPGHSPGHICLYAPERRLLFSGDHILNEITPNIAWHPGADLLGDYMLSLERTAELEVDLVLPSHGEPFPDHRQWIRQTIEHHRERCDQIMAALVERPAAAHDIVSKVWARPLHPIHHHFAVLEIMAHLEYMRRQGRVCLAPSGTRTDAALHFIPSEKAVTVPNA